MFRGRGLAVLEAGEDKKRCRSVRAWAVVPGSGTVMT